MLKTLLRISVLPGLAVTAIALGACGSEGIELSDNATPQTKQGAELFAQRCAGCHTLRAAGTQGSAVKAATKEYKDGPNFNVRKETYEDILYAIRNGGFSSGPMPQNIVVGEDARAVARFLSEYSGKQAPKQ